MRMLESRTKGSHVKVGVLGANADKDHGGGNSVVDIAMIHEFGAPAANIPERSFIRSTMVNQKGKIAAIAGKISVKVLTKNMSVPKALNILGIAAVSMIKRTITKSVPPPLKPDTVKAKGSSKPLIDTGQLLNSITHEVITSGS